MKRLIIPGLIAFLLLLVATFPARVAYNLFTPNGLQLSGISGSIWSGAAAEGVAGGAYIQDIAWQLKPASLFSGDLAFATSSRPMSGKIEADLAVSPNGTLTLSGVTGRVPLDLVHPLLQQNGLRGDIELEFSVLEIRNGVPTSAVGFVTLSNFYAPDLASSRIGDFRADITTADDDIVAQVADLDGSLDLDGVITVNADRSFSFLGQVGPAPGAPASIANQLRGLGTPDARGRHEFRFEGQL